MARVSPVPTIPKWYKSPFLVLMAFITSISFRGKLHCMQPAMMRDAELG